MVVSVRYCVLSVLSGCFWAAIAYWLGGNFMSPMIWGGIIASPFIGLAIGLAYQRVCDRPLWVKFGISLTTLYAAVAMFGFACGVWDALRPIPNRFSAAVVEQSILGCWWGITFTGLFLILWPLSFLNHSIVCHFGKLDD
jgi:hypothetical protein